MWSQRSTRPRHGWLALVLGALLVVPLAGCSHSRSRTRPAPQAAAKQPAPSATPASQTAAPGTASAAGSAVPGTAPAGTTAAAGAPPAPPRVVPPAARADFDRAVNYMRAGNVTEAELGLKQVDLQYPQFATPLVNLAILERKGDHLDTAEATLRKAVAREPANALAWTELGVTQRMRGEFKEAAASYDQALAADPNYAPAWRNLGVLDDLYLGRPEQALPAFEKYKEITGEDKPVSGWIAELRQRLGMPAPKKPAAGDDAGGSAGAAAPADAGAPAPEVTPPAGGANK